MRSAVVAIAEDPKAHARLPSQYVEKRNVQRAEQSETEAM